MHRTTITLGVFFMVSAASGLAVAKPAPPRTHVRSVVRAAAHTPAHAAARPAVAARPPASVSAGSPTEGHLLHGVRLQTSAALRISPGHAAGDVRYGVRPLVAMLERAAALVAKQRGGVVLTVGHLSLANGGEVAHHVSHESGRDADVAFYVQNARGGQLLADDYVAFTGDAAAPAWPGAKFDDAANWALVAAMLSDAEARVSHIFVAAQLRDRLLAYARRVGAHPDLRERAAEVLAQPRGSLPHDDHFHVRISCPRGMSECIEVPVARALAHAGRARPGRTPRTAGRIGQGAHAHVAAQPAGAHAPALGNARTPAARRPELQSADDDLLGKLIGPKVEGMDSILMPARVTTTPAAPARAEDDVDGVASPLAAPVPVGEAAP